MSRLISSPNADISVKVNDNKLSSFLQDLNLIKNELAQDHKEDLFVKRGLSKIEEERKNKLKSQRDKNNKPAAKRVNTPKGSSGPEGSSGYGSAKSFTEFGTKSRSRDRNQDASAQSSYKRKSPNQKDKSTLRDDGNKENHPANREKSTEKRGRDPSAKE